MKRWMGNHKFLSSILILIMLGLMLPVNTWAYYEMLGIYVGVGFFIWYKPKRKAKKV